MQANIRIKISSINDKQLRKYNNIITFRPSLSANPIYKRK